MKIIKSPVARLFIVFVLLMVIMLSVVGYFNNIEFDNRIFADISECQKSQDLFVSDIDYNSHIEPKNEWIKERCAKTIMYDNNMYEFYAYELGSAEYAKMHFEAITKKEASENVGTYLDFENGLPLITFHEHKLYMVYYYDCSYSELAELVNTLTMPFAYNVDEIIVQSYNN